MKATASASPLRFPVLLTVALLVIFRRLCEEWWRVLLVTLAVALGVAVFLAVTFAARASIDSFSQTAELFKSPLEIRSRDGSISPASSADYLPLLARIGALVPFAEREVELEDGTRVSLLAIDTLALSSQGEDLTVDPGEPVFFSSAPLAELKSEPLVCVWIASMRRCLPRRPLPDDLRQRLPAGLLVLELSQLAKWEEGGFSLSGFSVAALVDGLPFSEAKKLVAEVSYGKWVLGGEEERNRRAQSLLAAFQLNIGVMVLMTLVVCGFTVFNAFQLTVRGLLPTLSMLHTLGLPRYWGILLVVLESLLVGLLGSVIGLSFGQPLSVLVAELFIDSARAVYQVPGIADSLLGVREWWWYPAGVGLGILLSLAGAILPAWRARAVRPAVGGHAVIEQQTVSLSRRGWYALTALAAAGLMTLVAMTFTQVLWAHLAALMIVIATAVAAAPLLQLFVRLMGRVVKGNLGGVAPASLQSLLPLSVLMGVSGLEGRIRTCAVSVGSSASAVALLVGLATMIGSFRDTLSEWVGYTISADLFISRPVPIEPLPSEFMSALSVVIDPKVVTRFAQRDVTVCPSSGGGCFEVPLQGSDIADNPRGRRYEIISGTAQLSNRAATLEALISESLARRRGLSPGAELNLSLAESALPHVLLVKGVYKDFSSERGSILIPYERFRTLVGVNAPFTLSLLTGEGESRDSVRKKLEALPGARSVRIQDQESLRAQVFEAFDRTFSITTVLRIIVLLVCALGFAVTLSQLHWDRRAEWATLHTLGAPRHAFLLAMSFESAALLIPSVILGVPSGVLLALILVHVVNPLSFGWTLEFRITAGELLLPALALMVVSAVPLLWRIAQLRREVRGAKLADE
jgi:ABC-type antimicrobial peptide transport system permease subunit